MKGVFEGGFRGALKGGPKGGGLKGLDKGLQIFGLGVVSRIFRVCKRRSHRSVPELRDYIQGRIADWGVPDSEWEGFLIEMRV